MECWLYWQYYLYNNHAFNAWFSLALNAESYSRSKMFDQFIRFILSVACAKEEECLSNNFKCRTHARLLYVLRFGDQSVSSLPKAREEILMATSWAMSREKSYRISMPRCLPSRRSRLPLNGSPEWRRGSFDFFRATLRNP